MHAVRATLYDSCSTVLWQGIWLAFSQSIRPGCPPAAATCQYRAAWTFCALSGVLAAAALPTLPGGVLVVVLFVSHAAVRAGQARMHLSGSLCMRRIGFKRVEPAGVCRSLPHQYWRTPVGAVTSKVASSAE